MLVPLVEALLRTTLIIPREETQSMATTIIGATDAIRFHRETAVEIEDDLWVHLVL